MFRRDTRHTIDIPALTDLVRYLRERDQSEVDELTGTILSLTERLRISQARLKGAMNEERKDG